MVFTFMDGAEGREGMACNSTEKVGLLALTLAMLGDIQGNER